MNGGYARAGATKLTPVDYLVEDALGRTVSFILSPARRHSQGAGIR